MGIYPPAIVLFTSFSIEIFIGKAYIDVVPEIRARGHRIVCADGSTELWWPPTFIYDIGSTLPPPLATFPKKVYFVFTSFFKDEKLLLLPSQIGNKQQRERESAKG